MFDLTKDQPTYFFDIVYVCLLVLFFSFGVFTGYSVKPDATCTTTITDMQGVEHTLKGKSDDTTN